MKASLGGVNIGALPLLRGTNMPLATPRLRTALPALLDDLPGRAALVINPRITVLNTSVRSWSDLNLLFFGADGRWRRLSLGDLGLPESLRYNDTYGAGQLSGDGRWWVGPIHRGVVALNLATGRTHLMRTGVGGVGWIPGRHSILTYGGSVITVPSGRTTARVPYHSGQVGYEPNGMPLSLERGSDGQAVLVEWRGRTRATRAIVPAVSPPRRQIKQGERIAADQLTPVNPTQGHFANVELRGREGLAMLVCDSETGEQVAELTWRRRDFELFHHVWLDEQTLLIATTPHFVAWRPQTGKLYRVTDARSLGAYWNLSVARDLVTRST